MSKNMQDERKLSKNELESAIAAISEGLEILKRHAAYAGNPSVKPVEAKKKMGTFKDPRDGQEYKTVKIGNQVWLAENLNYEAKGSKCYDNDPKNAKKYGRLYDWKTAKTACPSGWHLPTSNEWEKLSKFVMLSGKDNDAKKLKAKTGWHKDCNGTDEFGFSALPGGLGYSDGSFGDVGYYGNWWSATERNSYDAYSRYMYYDNERAYWYSSNKSGLFSVRCVKDKS